MALSHGETLTYNNYLSLWQKYLVMASAVAPPHLPSSSLQHRSISPSMLATIQRYVIRAHSSLHTRTQSRLSIARQCAGVIW
jgi:hypothetical protein